MIGQLLDDKFLADSVAEMIPIVRDESTLVRNGDREASDRAASVGAQAADFEDANYALQDLQ
jgi:hypothetical protein